MNHMMYFHTYIKYLKKLFKIKIMEQILAVEQELELLERLVKEKQDVLFCLKCEVKDNPFANAPNLKEFMT